jgi:hypothetical protein
MLKKIAALLQRKPFPVPKEEIVEVVSLSEKPKPLKKLALKKATTRKPVTKNPAAKVAVKKTAKKKNAG